MTINSSPHPAREAGEYLSDRIEAEERATLCLLSGGSALDIIEHIELSPAAKRRTIFMMGDERWSREESVNNYLQLAERYPEFVEEHTLVETSVHEDETQEAFAARIHSTIDITLHDHEPVFVISLMGVGEDGHTAGIFPMDEATFAKTYPDDTNYTSVITSGLSVNFRASVTPGWIRKNVDEIILYAAGQNKLNILTELKNQNKPINDLPVMLIKTHPYAIVFTDQTIL